ncbi:DUF2071 domain-containing protein [Rapidithrix thailandica]|uniref:DUF2071 domain-containing protein n=1 Tax=Rapidithrix thailandica TaxID=413964 RepID=A0AAW9RZW1_9BACT
MMTPTTQLQLQLRQRPHKQRTVMFQEWKKLLFLHWRVPADQIQKTLPPGLTVDTYQGEAFVGVVPFYMQNIRPVYCPAVPGISNFLETNVRTYVYDENGVPGVWFYSLDANQWLACWLGKNWFQLPYRYKKMQAQLRPPLQSGFSDKVHYQLHHSSEKTTRIIYQGKGNAYSAEPGTLEFFLVERYALYAYAKRSDKLYRGRVYHPPYQIAPVAVESYEGLGYLSNFEQVLTPPEHQLYSQGVKVDVYGLEEVWNP